ncbi:MAG TPA: TIGR04282 family arsenosugar biosynthesis glycosyltransferase [Gammaproteobacteria bacterium]|nr:TIGR04282 family arsenosugar biosynthesis glycosyltransferase [Gammaproteobacteria bacterium]
MHSTKILIFAKAPEPGRTKTRLIPKLGAEGAADLHAQLIRHAVTTACAASLGPVELWCTPSTDHPLFTDLAADGSIRLREQPPGDLGARMHAALDDALAMHTHALLIGSDCPGYSVEYFQSAGAALASGSEAVLGPAADGGYVLIGLTKNHSNLFSNVPWGTGNVLQMTRQRLHHLGWRLTELATLRDIDRPEDMDYIGPAR